METSPIYLSGCVCISVCAVCVVLCVFCISFAFLMVCCVGVASASASACGCGCGCVVVLVVVCVCFCVCVCVSFCGLIRTRAVYLSLNVVMHLWVILKNNQFHLHLHVMYV